MVWTNWRELELGDFGIMRGVEHVGCWGLNFTLSTGDEDKSHSDVSEKNFEETTINATNFCSSE